LVDRAGHLRRTPEPAQQRVHPALGVPHAPALLDPPPDLGRGPEPPRLDLAGQLGLLLGRQERRGARAVGMPPLHLGQAARPIPGQPALHRPLLDPDDLRHLARRPTGPHQPKTLQPRTHVRPTLPTIPRTQARRIILHSPRDPQLPSPPLLLTSPHHTCILR